jgi:hypothetical protein
VNRFSQDGVGRARQGVNGKVAALRRAADELEALAARDPATYSDQEALLFCHLADVGERLQKSARRRTPARE